MSMLENISICYAKVEILISFHDFFLSLLTGRKLTTLVDIFVEEKRRGRIISPEYLTKVPCGFEVTELVLKQILVCHADTKRKLLGQNFSNNTNEVDFNAEAKLYVQMCRRWSKIHPEVKLTMKQMISIHHMLNFEPGKDDPSPGMKFPFPEAKNTKISRKKT